MRLKRVAHTKRVVRYLPDEVRFFTEVLSHGKSTESYHRILKLAHTIANFAESEEIQSMHWAAALHSPQPSEDHDINIAVDDGQKYGLLFENFI